MKTVIEKYKNFLGVDDSRLAILLGVSYSAVNSWSVGNRTPGGPQLSAWYCAGEWRQRFAIEMMTSINEARTLEQAVKDGPQ